MVRARVIITLGVVASFLWLAVAMAQAPRRTYLPQVAGPLPSPTHTATLPAAPSPTASATATATATIPGSTPTPTLPPAAFVDCGTVSDPGSAPNYPVRIVDIDKAGETVTLQNVGPFAISLQGWRMCSVTGGQEHGVSGVLLAGQARTIFTFGGPIWNNSSSDPGALWNSSGQLVSYFPD